MSDQPLVLPFRSDHEQLVEGLSAIVRAIEALKSAEQRTELQTQRTASALEQLDKGLGRVRGGFTDAWQAVETWVDRVNRAVDRTAALVSEQQQLERLTARTGLNFDEAAAAAGRFADETEAAGAAGAFLQAGTQLTQRELNAVMRVAGAAAQTLGITTTQATQQLTEALRKGEAEGLGRFSPALAALAGQGHTTAERLDELVRVADRTTAATDDAADAARRFRDSLEDGARTISTSFVREMQRLDGLGRPFREGREDAEEFNRTLQAVGQTAAHLVSGVTASLRLASGAVNYAGAQALRPLYAAARAAGIRTPDHVGGAEREMRDALNRLEALQGDLYDDRRTAPTAADDAAARAPARPDMAISAAERDAAEAASTRARRGRGGRSGTDPFEARLREENAVQDALREVRAERERIEQMLQDAAQEQRDQRAQDQRDRDQTTRDREADMGRQRWDRSDPGLRAANDNARIERQEARALDQRRQNLRSFTDFYEDQHSRQLVAAREAANGVAFAFDSMGKAYAKHLMAVVHGREELGVALQGMLADTLNAIAEESAKQAGLNLAGAFAALATYRYDAAANHFAAFGIYTGLAVGTGLAGAAVTPAAAQSGGAAAAASGSRDRVSPGRSSGAANDNSTGATVIEMHYYAPVIGGREATSAEVGRGMERYASAADRRRLGRTGTGP